MRLSSLQSSNSTDIRFVNLDWNYNKPWIKRNVRNVNLRFDRVLLWRGKSHVHVTDNMSFQTEFTTHGLHLNSRGKKLTLLIIKSLGDNKVSGISNIPVITSERSSLIFSLEARAQRCLIYFNCIYLQFRNQDRTVVSSTSLQMFHQNIR
jgi:hypothetical protein